MGGGGQEVGLGGMGGWMGVASLCLWGEHALILLEGEVLYSLNGFY